MKIKNRIKTCFKERSLGKSLLVFVMLFILFVKAVAFYGSIKLGSFAPVLACATVLITALVHLLLLIFAPKAADTVLTVLYFFISVLMCADAVYFGDRGRLISAAVVKLASQLTHVTGSVEQLITPRRLLSIIDLPLWIAFFVARGVMRRRRAKDSELTRECPLEKKPKRLLTAVLCNVSFTAVLAIIFAASLLFGSFKLAYLPNELLIYHVQDIYSAFFSSRGSVDKNSYVYSKDPDNPYYGIAEGRNVFVIQVEALQSFVLGNEYKGDEITPFMNSLLANDTLYFENYYYQIGGGNTSDAEFTVNNSLYARDDASCYIEYADNDYYGLPWLLRDAGYSTATVFHGYVADFWNRETAYVKQGFNDFISVEDFKQRDDFSESEMWAMDGGGLSDRGMFSQTANIVSTYEEPFYSFIITLSTHSPFGIPLDERHVDADNPQPDLYTLYLQSVRYFDQTLEEFFNALKEEGLYENSVFVLYGDHFAISDSEEYLRNGVRETTGRDYDVFDRYSVPLIIHIPGLGEAKTLDTVGGHVDVMPTLLCLLGIENDKSVMFGHNLLAKDYEGIAYELTHLEKGSFFTKSSLYKYTKGGISSVVYNRDGSFGDPQDEQYLKLVEQAQKAVDDSRRILDNNDVLLK